MVLQPVLHFLWMASGIDMHRSVKECPAAETMKQHEVAGSRQRGLRRLCIGPQSR